MTEPTTDPQPERVADCIFCRIVAGEIPSTRLFADDRVVVFMDINPISPGHCLVVPKAHHPSVYELTDTDGAAVMSVARRVGAGIRDGLAPDGLNLHQSNGAAAGQVVGHFHLHLIPRWEGDGASIGWRPSAEAAGRIAETAERIVQALASSGE
ncbi:MAG: HIT family protein [Actinomycetota bacterium]